MTKQSAYVRRQGTSGLPRVRRTYTPAGVNEAVAAMQQNSEVHLNEAQAMSMLKSLFVLGFIIVNVGRLENDAKRICRAEAGQQDRKPVNGQ